MNELLSRLSGEVVLQYAAVGASFAVVLITAVFLRSLVRGVRARSAAKAADERTTTDDFLTWVVAAIATAVSAEGSYQVFVTVIKEDWLLWSTFCVIELIMLVSAIRARRHMREFGASGIDGIAVWLFAGIIAVLAGLHELSKGHLVATLVRVLAPLASAYLWERGMRLAQRIRKGRKSINWTIGLTRILVRLGLAEPTERDTGEVAAHRYLTRLAIKTARLRQLETSPGHRDRTISRAAKAQRNAMQAVLEHTDYAVSPRRKEQFMAIYGALVNASALTKVTPKPFWEAEAKAQSPYPPIVVPETVVMEPPPPVPVLATAKTEEPKPAPTKAVSISRGTVDLTKATEAFKNNSQITGAEFIEASGLPRSTAYKVLKRFQDQGIPNGSA